MALSRSLRGDCKHVDTYCLVDTGFASCGYPHSYHFGRGCVTGDCCFRKYVSFAGCLGELSVCF